MNNQAEVTVAMQGVDDVMKEMWTSIAENDARISAERVEATYVLAVVEAHRNLTEALKLLRDAYTFYAEPAPTAENVMREVVIAPLEADLGINFTSPNCDLRPEVSFSPTLEEQNPSND